MRYQGYLVEQTKSNPLDFDKSIYERVLLRAKRLVAKRYKLVDRVYTYENKIATREDQTEEELEKEKFKIAVFGNFSCGKSTFLNALMRIDKLPVKEERATAVFTVLRNAEEHGKQHGEAEIHFKDKDFLRADIVEGIKELGMTAELELDKQEQIYE